MRDLLKFLCGVVLLLAASVTQAQQSPEVVRKAIEAWLPGQTVGLPGEISYEIGAIGNTRLAPCGQFDISRPANAPAWGRGHVTVHCLDAPGWRINVPIRIRVKADYYVAARPIPQGQIIMPDDLLAKPGDLADLPERVVTDANLAIGKMAAATIPIGAALRSDMLRATLAIRQGQTVRVISRGPGFEVTNEGRAMSNTADGQLAQIRMPNGQIVSGVARQGGIVEIISDSRL